MIRLEMILKRSFKISAVSLGKIYECECFTGEYILHSDQNRMVEEAKFIIFLDNTKLKTVWIKITTFFKRRVSIIL